MAGGRERFVFEAVIVYCLNCQYDLRNLSRHRCPECGRGFDPDVPGSFSSEPGPRRRWPKFLVAISAAWFFLTLAMCFATRVAAYIVLGHAPVPNVYDPNALGPITMFLCDITSGMITVMPVAFCINIAGVIWTLSSGNRTPKSATFIMILTVVVWMGGFWLLGNAFPFVSFAE